MRIRVDILTENEQRLSEPVESEYGTFPAEWWPTAAGAQVVCVLSMRPEVLALYPDLPHFLRVKLTGLE